MLNLIRAFLSPLIMFEALGCDSFNWHQLSVSYPQNHPSKEEAHHHKLKLLCN
jgi:hypothetical protein